MEYSISIIIPVYNVEKYIVECLESVAIQNIDVKVECILVDDCGGDNSIKVASEFISNYDGPIHYSIIHHNRNKGLSEARNTGITASNGEYLYFLDSDDKLFPNSLQTMWSYTLKYPGVEVVQGNLFSEDTGGLLFTERRFPKYSNNPTWIKTSFCGLFIPESACNRLIKREVVLKNNLLFMSGWIQEDTLWSYRIHDSISSIAFSTKPTYFYRKNGNSIMHSSGLEKEANAFAKIFNYVYDDLTQKKIHSYEIRYLELMAIRIERSIGKIGLNILKAKGNIVFQILFTLNRVDLKHLNNIPLRILCKMLAFFVRRILCIKNIYLNK